MEPREPQTFRPFSAESAPKVEGIPFINAAQANTLYGQYFSEYLTQVGSGDHDGFNKRIASAISGEVAVEDDAEYFKLVQLGFYKRNAISSTLIRLGRTQIFTSSIVFTDLLYQGVSSRIDQKPDFAEKFIDFAVGVENYYATSQTNHLLWSSITTECLRRSRIDRTHHEKTIPWNKISQAIMWQQ